MHPKDVEGMANSVDPEQTAPKRFLYDDCSSGLGLHCLQSLSVQTLRIIRLSFADSRCMEKCIG